MSLRDYEGWRKYGEWKKKNYENYQKQMSDGLTETKKGTYFTDKKVTHKTIPTVKDIEQNLGFMPDQKWHRIVSFIKSGIRIAGYAFIPFNLWIATGLLIASEVVGIIEELV